MQPRRRLAVALILVATMLTAWYWWPADASPPAAASQRQTVDDGSLPPAQSQSTSSSERVDATGPAALAVPTSSTALHVRLRGLHPDLPWSAPLRLELSDRGTRRPRNVDHDVEGAVDEDGRCVLSLPSWWQPNEPARLRIQARNPGYRDLHHRRQGVIDAQLELVVDVQPVATVEGRVTDLGSRPVQYARVSAFALRNGDPVGYAIGEAGTSEHGRYVLQAPPDVPLLLVATPMRANTMRWRRLDSVQDNGELRDDLLPASREILVTVRVPRAGIDFVLPNAANITGTVLFPDGTPVTNARVRLEPAGGMQLQLGNFADLVWRRGQQATPAGSTGTDDEGRFKLAASPGAQADVMVTHVGDLDMHGSPPRHRVVAPQVIEITQPRPVTVRAMHAGQPVGYARIRGLGSGRHRTDKDGSTQVLVHGNAVLRADRGPLRSSGQKITPDQQGQTVDLVMTSQRIRVSVEFEGGFRVRNASFRWHRQDGMVGIEHLIRDDRGGAFEVWLDPDRYRVCVGPADGERNGVFLLPVDRSIELVDDPVELLLPAVFGGTFTLQVKDREGVPMGGHCRVLGHDGTTYRAPLIDGGATSVFRADAPARFARILPPGEYVLIVELGAAGVHRPSIVIRAREVTAVVLRLP